MPYRRSLKPFETTQKTPSAALKTVKTVQTVKIPLKNSQKIKKAKNTPIKTVKSVSVFVFCQSDS